MNRRTLIRGALAGAATLALPVRSRAATPGLDRVLAEVEKRHDEAVKRLQEWIHQPTITAENRGVVNQKGPESAFLAALHAFRGAGRKSPVNFVFVAEGEEEIGSPHFPQVVRRPDIAAALKRCNGIFMPAASQGLDGVVLMTLGAKGVVELELTSSGEKWGRGPRLDIHSSNK